MEKAFFREPTAKEILEGGRAVREIQENIVRIIWDLPTDEVVIINRRLVPSTFENSRKFLRHGTEVKIKRFRTLDDAISSHITPVELRNISFDSLSGSVNCGYTFRPNWRDRRLRKVRLVECLEGTKLYGYSVQAPKIAGRTPSIIVKPYVDAKRVGRDGGEIIVGVPSRTEGRERYGLRFGSVPVVDDISKWSLAYTIKTDHVCGRKRFDIRYNYEWDVEGSDALIFCVHDIAAYLAIIDYFIGRKNLIPLQMSQFAIPTQETVSYYDKLAFNVLIRGEDGDPRKLDMADREVSLWGAVDIFGHDRTFYATEKVRDYTWRHIDELVTTD